MGSDEVRELVIDMKDPRSVEDVLSVVTRKDAAHELLIRVEDEICEPNVCAPIAGLIDYFIAHGGRINKIVAEPSSHIGKTYFDSPLTVDADTRMLANPFGKVWSFSLPDDVMRLTDAFVAGIRGAVEIEAGITQAITWCVNETMDNVLQHSNASKGFVMARIDSQMKRVALSVFDCGRGILNSFRESGFQPCPASPESAVAFALKEKVTRDSNVGQGNGLWGLSRLVAMSGGSLRVSSGGGAVFRLNGHVEETQTGDFLFIDSRHGTTLVDFQLDYSVPMDVSRILGGSVVDLWLEDHETESGEVRFMVKTECAGTGTRKSAERFRNVVVNTYRETGSKIVLDFDGVEFISSSFADELIGKLMAMFGVVSFQSVFQIRNLSAENRPIVNRSVEQRLAMKYYDNKIPCPED